MLIAGTGPVGLWWLAYGADPALGDEVVLRPAKADDSLLDRHVRQRRAIDIVQTMSICNKERLQHRDPAVWRKSREEMRRIAADPKWHYEYLLGTSMIASMRKAATIT